MHERRLGEGAEESVRMPAWVGEGTRVHTHIGRGGRREREDAGVGGRGDTRGRREREDAGMGGRGDTSTYTHWGGEGAEESVRMPAWVGEGTRVHTHIGGRGGTREREGTNSRGRGCFVVAASFS
eukprot:366192-Chlamydomonas_euryale.AAC.4